MDFLEIIGILLPILILFGGGIRKSLRRLGPLAEPTPQPKSEVPFPWETEFDEELEPEEFVEEEPQVGKGQNAYFTYEDLNQPVVNLETDSAPQRIVEEEPSPMEVAAETASVTEAPFDLRKAIIYQTILTNNYTLELK